MRTNTFGDKYCHTVEEARAIIEAGDSGWKVYATTFDPPESSYKATCEVVQNDNGEMVCYIEADTLMDVQDMVTALQLEIV